MNEKKPQDRAEKILAAVAQLPPDPYAEFGAWLDRELADLEAHWRPFAAPNADHKFLARRGSAPIDPLAWDE